MSQPEQWQLSGNAAEMYERYVVPYLLGPWAPSRSPPARRARAGRPAYCRHHLERQSPRSNASAVAMQLGDATYDVVLCQQGLQPALRGSQSDDLAVGTVNQLTEFPLQNALQWDGKSPSKSPAIWRMSGK